MNDRDDAGPDSASAAMLEVMDRLPVGIAVMNRDGRCRMANAHMRRLAGTACPDLEDLSSDRWQGYDRNGLPLAPGRHPLSRALQDGIAAEEDFLHRDDDGSQRWVHLSVSLLRDDDGQVSGAVCCVQDIDEAKRSRGTIEALALQMRDRVDELETLLQALPVGVFVARDPQCTEITMNEAGAALLRLPRDGNASKTGAGADRLPFRVFAQGRELAGNELPMQRAAREGVPIGPIEVDVRFQDGDAVRLYEYAVPLLHADGAVRGCVGVFVDISERARAEQAIADSERFMGAVLDALPAQVAVLDRRGCIAAINEPWRRFARTCGVASPERAGIGADYLAVCRQASRAGDTSAAEALRGIAQVLAGELDYFHTEYACATPQRMLWFSMHVVPGADEFGGAIVVHIEVTERRRIEDALMHEREMLQAIIARIPVMVAVQEPERHAVRLNPEFERVLGWGERDAEGVSLLEQCLPDPEHRAAAVGLMRTRRSVWRDLRMRARDGRVVHTSWAGVRLSNRTRVGIGIDITERKRAEMALRESERRFRQIADSAPVLMWMNDATGCIFANRATLQFLGLPATADPRALSWSDYVHPDDRELHAQRYRECVERGGQVELECRLRRHDGAYRWVRTVGVARRSEMEGFQGCIGCTFDIHDVHMAAAALEETDKRKDEFIATLAHELRNPLAPISHSLHLLRRSGADEAAAAPLLDMMERQVRHMVRLVDDLLEISRITRGTFELRPERVELSAVVQSAVETAMPLIERAGHRLHADLPAEPVWLEADPVRLAQILANLLNNAALYTDPGGWIAIGARPDGGFVTITVRDNGAGIAPESLPHLFEMFRRGDRGAGRGKGGLGIGLAIARRLAEMHGATLAALSEGPGRGSEFTLRMPRGRQVFPPAQAVRPGAAAHAPLRVPRVMVVDDNEDAADSLGMVLQVLGVEVAVARGGHEALERFGRFRPDMVLLDIGMPDIDGYEVARSLRSRDDGRAVTLVALTGWGQERDTQLAREAGFDHHLVKPVDIAVLQRLLADVARPG